MSAALMIRVALGCLTAVSAVSFARAAFVAIRGWWRSRQRERAERQWADTCARYPWRVAAVREGGPLMLLMDDDLLRLWWEREGRLYPSNADLVEMEAKGSADA